jgi:hypothetical protein
MRPDRPLGEQPYPVTGPLAERPLPGGAVSFDTILSNFINDRGGRFAVFAAHNPAKNVTH